MTRLRPTFLVPTGIAVAIVVGAMVAIWWANTGSASEEVARVMPGDAQAADGVEPPAADPPAAAASALGTERRVPPAAMERLRASASPDEWAVIEDGVVTRAEVEAAFWAADGCTRAAAAEIGRVTIGPATFGDPDGPIGFGHGQSDSKEALDRVGEAHLACVARYFDDVLDAWDTERSYAAHQPSWDRMAACLAEKGLPTRPGMDLRQLADAVGPGGDPADVATCQAAATQGG
jgi:hypothetical protein